MPPTEGVPVLPSVCVKDTRSESRVSGKSPSRKATSYQTPEADFLRVGLTDCVPHAHPSVLLGSGTAGGSICRR